MMNRPFFISSVIIIACLLLSPAGRGNAESGAAAEGLICISPIPEPSEVRILPGERRDFNFSVQVDDGEILHLGFNKDSKLENLSLRERHLVKIRRSGKLVESFWFDFNDYQSNSLCLWFYPLHQTWSLWDLDGSRHLCSCGE